MERALRIPLPSAIRYAKELQKEGILDRISIGTTTFYTGSTSKTFVFEKKLFNLQALHMSGIIDYIEQAYSSPTVVLFGSFDKGEDIETSDIDLYIETPSRKELDLSTFEKRLGRKIEVFRHTSIRDIANKELGNSIINGTVLRGFLEVL
jgi:predicted nucleotidyltransferase